jgi:UDP-glucose-4-epimerase GalE
VTATPSADRAADGTVLVAGGAGYIGSHAVRALQQAGLGVVILDNLSTGHREAVPAGVPLVEGRVGDIDLVRRTLCEYNVQAVMHFCAFAYVGESVADPQKYYRNNLVEGLGLLEAMLAEDVKRIIFSSSCTVYGVPDCVPIDETQPTHPISPYGRTKRNFEEILADYEQAYDLRFVSLRYFNAAGAAVDGSLGEDHDPETHLIPLVLRQALAQQRPQRFRDLPPLKVFGKDYPTPDGTCIRDYIHVEDLADAHVKALQRLMAGGASLTANLGTGRGTSVLDVIKACQTVTGVDIPFEFAPRRPGDPAELVAKADLAARELHWQPSQSDIRNIIVTAWRWQGQGGFTGEAAPA